MTPLWHCASVCALGAWVCPCPLVVGGVQFPEEVSAQVLTQDCVYAVSCEALFGCAWELLPALVAQSTGEYGLAAAGPPLLSTRMAQELVVRRK